MSRLDYSKWDKMEYSSDDEDNEENNNASKQPSVTRLDDGSRIHIGPSGSSISHDTTLSTPTPTSSETPISSVSPCSQQTSTTKAPSTIYKSSHTPEGGGFPITYSWKQTRQEVYLWLPIAHALKASALQVQYTSSTNNLRISTSNIDLLAGELKYKILQSTKENETEDLDWEVTTPPQAQGITSISSSSSSSSSTEDPPTLSLPVPLSSQKVLQIIFQKHVYTPGSVVWWSSIFATDDAIDVTQIPERLQMQKRGMQASPTTASPSTAPREGSDSSVSVSSTEQFAEAWKVAHGLFVEKVKTKEPITVYDDDDVECEQDEAGH